MGNRNSNSLNRSCFQFSVKISSVKKPALYVEKPDYYDPHRPSIIEAALHAQLSQRQLDAIWEDVDTDEMGFVEGSECLILIRDIIQELPHLTRVQLETAHEAIDRLFEGDQVRKQAERKASLSLSGVERKNWNDMAASMQAEREARKQEVTKRAQEILDRIEKTNSTKNLQDMADELAASLKGPDGRITKASFDEHFQTNLRAILRKHGVEVGSSVSGLVPGGSPSLTAKSVTDDTPTAEPLSLGAPAVTVAAAS